MIIETRKIQINDREIDLVIRRHNRAKNFKLSCDASGSRVLLTLPQRGSLKSALGFYEKSQDWLSRHLPNIQPAEKFNGKVLYLGKPHVFDQKTMAIIWLKNQALQHLTAISERMAKQLGVTFNNLRVKDLKTRWGSCSSKGNLNYSWRIIMAPPRVVEYLCAHEVSHLIEMNHSPAFWRLVSTLCPDYKESRKWLRTEGKMLLQYG